MNPLYLGSAERRIFGIHEPAGAVGARNRAVVLCHPSGAEYIHAHRAMRQLALRLSRAGHHTLRFDYFGTGDSDGEAAQGDIADWAVDVESAIETVREIAAVPRVALVGLRAGANVAAEAVRRVPALVEALVLWDPLAPEDLKPLLAAPPCRSLLLVSEGGGAYEELARSAAPCASHALSIEFIAAPHPWVEEATTSGALPVRILQRIDAWLR